ncbi:MAG TPA: DNA glycosylase [Methanoregulaceae archaeon]|nr:DNA glycosylase [Methanoregulaceae archaeon]
MPSGTIDLDETVPFSLYHTLHSGQAFRWQVHDGVWTGVVRDTVITLAQTGQRLSFGHTNPDLIRNYFHLDLDLDAVLRSISIDPYITHAVREGYGLRIVRQDPWECLISYIASANMKAVTTNARLEVLAGRWGEAIPSDEGEFHQIPAPEVVAEIGVAALRVCGFGYRARLMKAAAEYIIDHSDWETAIGAMDYHAAHARLTEIPGVGPKVADCVLLFGFNKYEAFPVDVHIRKIVGEAYFQGEGRSCQPIERQNCCTREFGRTYFGAYAGYASQYLFNKRFHRHSKLAVRTP